MKNAVKLSWDSEFSGESRWPSAGQPAKLRRGQEALALLLEAFEYAREVDRELWDFAVEISSLQQAGCTNSEFRWLVCRGFLDHAQETTLVGEPTRAFKRSRGAPGLTFRRNTCFVLTETGYRFAKSSLEIDASRPVTVPFRRRGREDAPADGRSSQPHWDRDRQELRVGSVVVKQFKVPAVNQERVLAAFEEEGWPVRIDDPLPPLADQDPKRRLHDTINSLNRSQKRKLIRFEGDGSGQGVRWHLISEKSGKREDATARPSYEPPLG